MSQTTNQPIQATPQWLTAKNIYPIFDIARNQLIELHELGYIRAAKRGERNGKVRYCCADIDAYLKAIAAGKKPKVMRGKTK